MKRSAQGSTKGSSTAKRGRPARAGAAATERIELRVTHLERAEWALAAAQAGVSLSEWIRQRCTDAARGMIGVP